jgi:hypothetical protein
VGNFVGSTGEAGLIRVGFAKAKRTRKGQYSRGFTNLDQASHISLKDALKGYESPALTIELQAQNALSYCIAKSYRNKGSSEIRHVLSFGCPAEQLRSLARPLYPYCRMLRCHECFGWLSGPGTAQRKPRSGPPPIAKI